MSLPVACITGAGGGIGSRLARELRATHAVRGLFRRDGPAAAAFAAAGGQVFLGDCARGAGLDPFLAGADTVYHAAAKLGGFSAAEFSAVNVGGTRAVARAAGRAGVRRVVHLSTAAVYAAATDPGPVWDEACALADRPELDAYTRSKLAAEGALRDELADAPVTWAIVRPTCVYGPGIASWTGVPLQLLRRGRELMFGCGDGAGRMNAVHVDDLVAGLVAVGAGHEQGVFNLGHEEVTFAEFYEALGALVGRVPRYATEAGVRALAARLAAVGRWIPAAAEVSRGLGLAQWMSRNQRPTPSGRAQRAFGYAPRLGLTVGLLATELALRGRGLPDRRPARPSHDGHYRLRPAAGARPRSPAELQAVIRLAAAAGLQVKAAGSLHTFAALPETPGVEVRLDRMDRVLVVDGDRVTVEPGLTLAALNRVLAARGLALPNHGSYLGQTLAGALATATHGGSLRTGTLADAVEAVALVGADGELRRWRRGEAEFGGVVAALGLLGVMAEVTLRCVPAFHLRGEPRVLPWAEFLARFAELHREVEFLDVRWHPEAGLVEVLEIRRGAPVPGPAPEVPALRPAGPAWRRRLVSANFRLLLRALGLPGAGPLRRAVARRWCGHGYAASAGPAEVVLAFSDLSQGEPFPIDDLEFAVPFARAPEALRALAAWFAGPGRPPRFFPVHLRASAAGEHWLAANHGQDVCWLEFWDYPGDPRWQAGLAAVLAPWAPRYHLGKTLPPDIVGEQLHLPDRARFMALREALDPTGRFLNAEAGRRLGLAGPGSASGPAAAGRAAASPV